MAQEATDTSPQVDPQAPFSPESEVQVERPPEARKSESVQSAKEPGIHTKGIMGRRRQFLVERRSQLRAGVLACTVVLVLLVVINVALHSSRMQSTARILTDAPELQELFHTQNNLEFALVALASVVFLAGVFVVTVLETHKTAGAAFNVARHMSYIADGRYGVKLKLRKNDNLRELEGSFNTMSQIMLSRALEEAEALEQLADAVENVCSPIEAEAVASQIRSHADGYRQPLAG